MRVEEPVAAVDMSSILKVRSEGQTRGGEDGCRRGLAGRAAGWAPSEELKAGREVEARCGSPSTEQPRLDPT